MADLSGRIGSEATEVAHSEVKMRNSIPTNLLAYRNNLKNGCRICISSESTIERASFLGSFFQQGREAEG